MAVLSVLFGKKPFSSSVKNKLVMMDQFLTEMLSRDSSKVSAIVANNSVLFVFFNYVPENNNLFKDSGKYQ